jgi:hypothetical protein
LTPFKILIYGQDKDAIKNIEQSLLAAEKFIAEQTSWQDFATAISLL